MQLLIVTFITYGSLKNGNCLSLPF